MIRWAVVLLVCALTMVVVPTVVAQDLPTPSAAQVVARVNAVGDKRPLTRKLRMTMTDAHGKERQRETIIYRKYFGEEQRTVVFYLAPANVRDTAFLTWDYAPADREDDQWLYLPALRKARRIPAADRGDYFLGTDLTYEDIKLDGKLAENDYAFTLEGTERDGDYVSYHLRAVPHSDALARELGYSQLDVAVDATTGLATRVDFLDLKGAPLKTLEVTGIAEVDGVWSRTTLEVRNHQTGHSTRFEFHDIDYNSDISDTLFTRRALERGR